MEKGSAPVYGTKSRELIYELNHKLSLLEGEIARPDEKGTSTLSRKAQEYFLSYRGILDTALENGEISRDEHDLLESIGEGMKDYKQELERALDEGDISPFEAAKMEALREDTMRKAMDQAMEDGVITEGERGILELLKEAERNSEEKLCEAVPTLRRELALVGRLFKEEELSAKKYTEELERILGETDDYLMKVSTLNKLSTHTEREEGWHAHVLRREMEQELEEQRKKRR